jgi:5'-3' exonuclease
MSIERVHIVDGTFELYRAHYAKRPPAFTPEGRDIKATLGVVDSHLALLKDREERVTHVAYAFDNPIRSFRNDLFADYKSDAGVPEVLRSQFDLVEQALRALGVEVWTMNSHEADDALASAACAYSAAADVRLLSPDKDMAQCLAPRVVRVDRIRKTVLTHTDFETSMGFACALLPDYLALTGDPQDGIPGLPGFGEQTAKRLVARYGGIEHIPVTSWDLSLRGQDRLLACFRERREDALLYKRLATLDAALPMAAIETLAAKPFPEDIEARFLALGLPLPKRILAERESAS